MSNLAPYPVPSIYPRLEELYKSTFTDMAPSTNSPTRYIKNAKLEFLIAQELSKRAITIIDNVQSKASIESVESQETLVAMKKELSSDSCINEIISAISSLVEELKGEFEKQKNSSGDLDVPYKININLKQNEIIEKIVAKVMQIMEEKTTNSDLKKAISEEIKKFLNDDSQIEALSKIILEILGYSCIDSDINFENKVEVEVKAYETFMEGLVATNKLLEKKLATTKPLHSSIVMSKLKLITRKIVINFISTITFLAGLAITASVIVLPFISGSFPLPACFILVTILLAISIPITIGLGILSVKGFKYANNLSLNILDTTLHDTIHIEITKMLLVLLNNPEVKDNPRINYRLLDENIKNMLSYTNAKLNKPYSDLIANQKVFIKNMHDALHSKDDFDQSKQDEYKKKNMQQAENMITAMFSILFESITDQNTKDILLKAKDKYLSSVNILDFYRHIFKPTILEALIKLHQSNKNLLESINKVDIINKVDEVSQEIFTEVIQKNLERYKTLPQGIAYATPVKSK